MNKWKESQQFEYQIILLIFSHRWRIHHYFHQYCFENICQGRSSQLKDFQAVLYYHQCSWQFPTFPNNLQKSMYERKRMVRFEPEKLIRISHRQTCSSRGRIVTVWHPSSNRIRTFQQPNTTLNFVHNSQVCDYNASSAGTTEGKSLPWGAVAWTYSLLWDNFMKNHKESVLVVLPAPLDIYLCMQL